MKITKKPVQKTFKMSSLNKTKKAKAKASATKVKQKKMKNGVKKMVVDELMSGNFERGDNSEFGSAASESSETRSKAKPTSKIKMKKGTKSNKEKSSENAMVLSKKKGETKMAAEVEEEEEEDGGGDGAEGSDDSDAGDVDAFKKHKEELSALQRTDPEFYEYLKENDEGLLNFDDSDDDETVENEEMRHTLPDSLEVASDESDFEPEEGAPQTDNRKITMAMVASWQGKLRNTRNKRLLTDVVDAFHAALIRVSAGEDELFRYKVEGSSVFNAIIRLCVMDLNSGFRSFLKIPEGSKTPPPQSKLWIRVRPLLKIYLNDLTELTAVTSPSMLTVLLKHIHQMSPFLVFFPRIVKRTLKRIIDLWSKSEDVVRILAFLCALRITNRNHSYLTSSLKRMHLAYVRNTKFVSPNTLAEINFMRQSLAEMFALDDTVSYQMAFIFIRQLAVHLRNAITLKKKENIQSVYNWQFVSSLQLWAELLALVPEGSPLRSLVYPLVQVVIGTIKLIPSSQYYPLRFHCCRILVKLSDKCGVFIPVLPFLLEVLSDFDFNREHKKVSMKPMDLTCLLRCSKAQMKENGFKDALVEAVNNLMIEYVATECFRISFPDTIVPAVVQLKRFAKECKVANYTKLVKALADKIQENARFVEEERKKLNLKLSDVKGVEAIEAGIRARGTPFASYHDSWKKVYVQQQMRKVVNNIKLGDYKLPVVKKVEERKKAEESDGPPELFPSDDEGSDLSFGLPDSDEEEGADGKTKKKKKKTTAATATKERKNETQRSGKKQAAPKKQPKKNVRKQKTLGEEEMDVVEDLQLSDVD